MAALLLLLLALLCLCGGAAGTRGRRWRGRSARLAGGVGAALADNFVPAMDDLNSNVSANGFGTSAVGTTAGLNPNAVFGLGQCYRDLSPVDCKLCFAEVRSLLPKCYPSAGGRLYLDGCFGRYANYSFFSETLGPDDAVTCGVVGGGGARRRQLHRRQPARVRRRGARRARQRHGRRLLRRGAGGGDGTRWGRRPPAAPRRSRSRSAGEPQRHRLRPVPPRRGARGACAPPPRRAARSTSAATSATPRASSGISTPLPDQDHQVNANSIRFLSLNFGRSLLFQAFY